jgi:gamma-butyrobetaine hydroxylase
MMQDVTPLEKTVPAIRHIHQDEFFLTIVWNNGRLGRYPFIFLRDNAPGVRHANGQKLIETAELPIACRPENCSLAEKEGIRIKWADQEEEQIFSVAWLWEHDFYNDQLAQTESSHGSDNAEVLWDHRLNGHLPEGDFTAICKNDEDLCTWLGDIHKYGFALLRNVPPTEGMVAEVVKLFGYIRETNYGRIFDVKTVIRPNNLAFTGLGISAHTDNPYRNPTPTLQLLHCLSSDANGGDSILADGFSIAEHLRLQYADYFKILSTTMVTYQFRDEETWLERSTPVITLYPDGTIAAVRLNNRSIQPVKLPPDDLLGFYRAYLQFAKMTNDEKYQVRFKMSPGDLYIVDNERITHARSGYDNKAGERWLQGAYAERDALLSRWRVLRHKASRNTII